MNVHHIKHLCISVLTYVGVSCHKSIPIWFSDNGKVAGTAMYMKDTVSYETGEWKIHELSYTVDSA